MRLCDDLVCRFSPVHAEVYDFTSAIPCTATESMLIPDDLSVPCWKTEEIGDTVAIQLTETVFENISSELRERVVEYFEESVDPEIRAGLGRGFLFRPYYASEKYDRKKKLVPEFPIKELFGKYLPEEF